MYPPMLENYQDHIAGAYNIAKRMAGSAMRMPRFRF